MDLSESGGFFPDALPSPSPSTTSVSSTSSNLPQPRAKPLRAGSAKEQAARRYEPEEGDSVVGYVSMKEVAKDLSEIIDVLWLSSTPNLQIPYLLNVALVMTTYPTKFPPAPVATFAVLRKLDHAFASLLRGEDSITGETLPGFLAGRRAGMSQTDMVRCRSIVEDTRVMIVDVMSKEAEPEPEPESGVEDDVNNEPEGMNLDEEDDSEYDNDELAMDIARVYEATMMELGERLESGPNIGIGHNDS
ncbi:meiotic recombination protein dmc1 [Botrytis cinerea]